MVYYCGDLEKDIASLAGEALAPTLDAIGQQIGYGRAQQILQILWARRLHMQGIPTIGALLPEPLEAAKPAGDTP